MTATISRRPARALALAAVAMMAMAALVAACGSGPSSPSHLEDAAGDIDRGRDLIRTYGCQTCHVVPGISGGAGRVGPELEGFARQNFIAGVLPNSPLNLARWVRDPQSINPSTAMPALGVSESDAHDIVAYLATLD